MSALLGQAMAVCTSGWQLMIKESASLERALSYCLNKQSPELRSIVQSLLYTTVRHRARVEVLLKKLVQKEPKENIKALLSISLALLLENKEKDFVVVDQAVEAAKTLTQTKWAGGFVNAVLRNFLRNRTKLSEGFKTNLCARFNAPGWWISKIRQAYPKNWQNILQVQNSRPPLTLRVNVSKISVEEFLDNLNHAGLHGQQVGPLAVIIEPPCPVEKIPGFLSGHCSVQDAGSQLVTQFLSLQDHDKVLDACAAPGGKTALLLESQTLNVTAMEVDPARASKIHETLSRLGLEAKIVVGDAGDKNVLNQLGMFDAILLDAPCTASGIVRRHPDIVWSRRPEDVKVLASRQAKLLEALWEKLPDGKDLLYIVCSIFPEEGPEQIENFLKKHPQAHLKATPLASDGMLRLLPTESENNNALPKNHDGFFYALLNKRSKS